MERPSTPPGLNKILLLIASIRRNFGAHTCTALILGLCCVVPGIFLSFSGRKPTLNRQGTVELFEITRRARLVQSFEADPTASVPQIWEKRLAPSAALDRWRRHGRGLWWLIWLDDGEPVLALPNGSDPSALQLLFADELHQNSFDQLTPLEQRHPSVLEQSCLKWLTKGTAVQWQPSGLASISGPLFATLASVSHGCLRVTLQGHRLTAEGPVASAPFVSLGDGPHTGPTNGVLREVSSAYLELNSVALKPLLGSFLNNPLIAEQLTSRYGLSKEFRDVLLNAPVTLRVDSLEVGRFQASVQARLMVPAEQIDNLVQSLDAASKALLQRGFQRQQRDLLISHGATSSRAAVVWIDPQGDLSGGWSLGPESQGRVEVLFALGDAPTLGQRPIKRHGQQHLRLRGRPDQLVRLGWLAQGWPRVIRNASQLELEMTALPKQHQPGWLRLQLELR